MSGRLRSRVYTGRVRHRRFTPLDHAFRYRMFMLYLDLDELPQLFDGSRLYAAHRPAPGSFRRRDHLGDPRRPLADCVRDEIRERHGVEHRGPIRLLTQPRYLGFVFNPISLYFCFDPPGERVEFVVADVRNTPWRERHVYVHDARGAAGSVLRFVNAKRFHVSPFLEMDYEYRWSVRVPGRALSVHIENWKDGRRHFDATLTLRGEALTPTSLRRAWLRFPFMTFRVVAGIYLQAWRLWRKKVPFQPHPSARRSEA